VDEGFDAFVFGEAQLVVQAAGVAIALFGALPTLALVRAGIHGFRYLGGYSNRTRRRLRAARAVLAGGGGEDIDTEPSVGTRELLGPDLTFEDAPPPPDAAQSLRRQS
jgi:hypothetical protein